MILCYSLAMSAVIVQHNHGLARVKSSSVTASLQYVSSPLESWYGVLNDLQQEQ